MQPISEPTHATTIRRVPDAPRPESGNGHGIAPLAGFVGYAAMFPTAIALSFVACSVAF